MSVPTKPPAGAAPVARAAKARGVLSLRWIVTGAVVALTTVVVASMGMLSERRARAELTAELETRLGLEARNLALTSAGALLTDYPELTLQPLVREMQSRQPELVSIAVADRNGVIHGHPDVRLLGTAYAPPPGLVRRAATSASAGEVLAANRDILMASAPILSSTGQRLGTAYVALRRDSIDRRLAGARRQQLVALAIFLALGATAAFVLTARLLAPLGRLHQGIERIGRGDLDTPLELGSRTELGMLAGAVNAMAGDLKRAQVEMVERERLSREMELAQHIQRSFVASGRKVAGSMVVESAQRPATEVGGDYVDVFELPDGRLGLAIADVSGKGLGGCLITSMLSVLLRAYRNTHLSPAAMLAALDERLGESLPRGSFVTMFYGLLEPATGRLCYASAGHSTPLLYNATRGDARWGEAGGLPLGASRTGQIRRTLKDRELELEPGDVMVQFTDGLSEALDVTGEHQFGLERLEQCVIAAAPAGAASIREALFAAIEGWRGTRPAFDDETVLVVSRDAIAGAGAGGGGASGEQLEVLALLQRAGHEGVHLRLPASLPALVRIDDWLGGVPGYLTLGESERECLRVALHEACSNVVEHGYGSALGKQFDLWWLPEGADAGVPAAPLGAPAGPAKVEWSGCFLLRDDGKTFRHDDWRPTDFQDPRARQRGRGFGLDIIHRAMRRVSYVPGTPSGNLTVMVFGVPLEHVAQKEKRYA